MVQIIGMGLLVVFGTWSTKEALGHCGEEMEWVLSKLLQSLLWNLPAMSRLFIH